MTRWCAVSAVLYISTFPACFSAAAADKKETPESSETTKVRSDGCAPDTTPASRDAAVLEARKNAVWLWLELELGETPGDEYLPLLDYLDHYTATFRLLNVHTDNGQTCVELEVYLYEWPLRADTAALLFRLRGTPPKIAFLFVEQDAAQGGRKFQGETRISKLFTDAFQTKGFTIVDATASAQKYSERELLSIAGGGEAALARYGAEIGADAVVAAEATLTAAPERNSAGGLRAKAEVVVRAVSTADGRQHDRSRGEAEADCANAQSGFGFALPDAVYKVRDRVIAGAVLAARASAAGGQQFRLTLEGVGDFVVAQRFAEMLRSNAGLADATVVSVRDGTALLSFTYGGKMAPLVDMLEAGTPGLPRIEARKVVGGEMVFQTMPAAQTSRAR